MKINLEVIPHNEQAYETCGDWRIDNEGVLQIRVSQTGYTDYNFLIGIHEIVESLTFLFRRTRSIEVYPLEAVEACDVFDKDFEKRRTNDTDEPGYDSRAPYHYEHMIASALEHNIAALLGVNYNNYQRMVSSLSQDEEKEPKPEIETCPRCGDVLRYGNVVRLICSCGYADILDENEPIPAARSYVRLVYEFGRYVGHLAINGIRRALGQSTRGI